MKREGMGKTLFWYDQEKNETRKRLGKTHRECWERGLSDFEAEGVTDITDEPESEE